MEIVSVEWGKSKTFPLPFVTYGATDWLSGVILELGDVKIAKDEGVYSNIPLDQLTVIADQVWITLLPSDTLFINAIVRIQDQTATKVFEDTGAILNTDITATLDVLESQLSGLANVGSAINRPAASYTLTTGTQSANTYTATEALDGTNHEHTDDAGTLDLYYEFNIGAGFTSSVQVTGYVNGNNDDVDVYGYDWVAAAWVQVGNIEGKAQSTNDVNSFDMFVDMVGSGANQGVVRVRFYKAAGLTSATLAVDQIFVAFNQTAEGYQNSAVWINSNASNTNTVKGIDGTSTNPVSTMAAVNTLLALTNLSRIEVISGSTVTLVASQNNQVFSGENWTLVLAGQDISGSSFIGAHVSGIATGTGTEQTFRNCHLDACTHIKETHFIECGIRGTQTVGEAGDYYFDRPHSAIAGIATWIFDFGAAIGDTNLNWRNGSGGIQLEKMGDTGTDTASIEGRGQIIEGTCTGGIVAARGAFTTSGITNLTLSDDARYDINQILDEPSAGLAIILDAIKTRLASTIFATEHPPATVSVPLGTILEGDVNSIQTLDQNYLKVQETAKFEIETTYTGIDEEHDRVYLTYRYFGSGSSNHKVELEIWNYDTSQYDDVVATDQDLPATNVDSSLIFDIPGTLSDHYDGSLPNLSAKLRIRHVSNNTTDHQFWLDTIGFGELEVIYEAPDNASIEIIREFVETFEQLLVVAGGGTSTPAYAEETEPSQIVQGDVVGIARYLIGDFSANRLFFGAKTATGDAAYIIDVIECTNLSYNAVTGFTSYTIPFVAADTKSVNPGIYKADTEIRDVDGISNPVTGDRYDIEVVGEIIT